MLEGYNYIIGQKPRIYYRPIIETINIVRPYLAWLDYYFYFSTSIVFFSAMAATVVYANREPESFGFLQIFAAVSDYF